MLGREPRTAEEWAIRLGDSTDAPSTLSAEERDALTRWLVANPERLKQLKTAQLIWRLGGQLTAESAERIEARARTRGHGEWSLASALKAVVRPPALAGLAVAASCLLFGVLFLQQPDNLNHLKNHGAAQTAIGEITSYVLPDNTNMTVAANSAVEVDFSKQKRTLHLNRGEVYLDVEHDREHPFVISVGGTHEVVVTGTKLNVNYVPGANAVEVAVLEGRINVNRHTAQPDSQEMAAGEVILFPETGAPERSNLTPEQAAAWRVRQLYFDDARLSEILTEVNRYTPKPLVIADPELERLTLTGEFTAGDTATLRVSLNKLYGITAQDLGGQWLLKANPK